MRQAVSPVVRRLFGAVLAGIMAMLVGAATSALADGAAADGRIHPGHATLDRADAEAWLDGFMPPALVRNGIAGATVSIVKDGQILLAKGYGYADVAQRLPVDAQRHLFRVASISKLFTWTAVMQQVELGRIDLDADINRYLDFTIPPYDGRPVTMRNLMTHSAGFELVMRNLFSARPNGTDLGSTVKHWIPERIHAPGTTPAYSNYGAALAGYIVQRVSGEPYDDYIQRHILQPLGMAHSTMRQPPPGALARNLSRAYLTSSGAPQPYEYTLYRPAGALASTAPDMARFMIAQLDDGASGAAHILRPETARLMHSTAFRAIPPLHGMTLGFYEHDINGHRVLVHDGDTRFFHSQLNLLLDDRVGLFVSLNSTGNGAGADIVRAALFEDFADRYFPGVQADRVVAPNVAAAHARAMLGTYDSTEQSASNFLGINAFEDQLQVTTDGQGHLVVPAFTGDDGRPRTWREIAPFVWRDVGGKQRLAALRIDGRPVRFSIDEYAPLVAWDRAPWWRSTAWLGPLSRVAYAIVVLAAVAWPVGEVMRRRAGRVPPETAGRQTARLGLWLAALAVLAVPFVWSRIIPPIMTFTADDATIDAQIILASLLTAFGVGGGLVLAAVDAALGWTERGPAPRIGSIAVALSFGLLLWVAVAFHLLTFSTEF